MFSLALDDHAQLMTRWAGYTTWRRQLTGPHTVLFPELPLEHWRNVLQTTAELYRADVYSNLLVSFQRPVLYTHHGARTLAAYLGMAWNGQEFVLLPEAAARSIVLAGLASFENERISSAPNDDRYSVSAFWDNCPWPRARHLEADNLTAIWYALWSITMDSTTWPRTARLPGTATTHEHFPWHFSEVQFRALTLLMTPSGKLFEPSEAYLHLERQLRDAESYWLVGDSSVSS